jgi:serine/threonine protein kinase
MNAQPAATALLQAALRRRLVSVKEALALRHVLAGCGDDPQQVRRRLGHGPAQVSAATTAELIGLLPEEGMAPIAGAMPLALLGTGRLGNSWLAQGQADLVVVKLLQRQLLPTPADGERLAADLAPLLQGGQRYLVAYLGVDAARPALVQRYRQGRDAAQRAEIKGEASEARALTLLRQAAKGLAQLHHLGRAHGHLHPGNILLDADGRSALSDWALALDPEARPRAGWEARALGRQSWAAPEELALSPHGGPAADIYALGCIAFWLLAGETPFTGTPAAQAAAHTADPRPDVRERAEGVSEITAKTILKCMQVDPAERYPDARALVHSLERNLELLERPVPDTDRAVKAVAADGAQPLALREPE